MKNIILLLCLGFVVTSGCKRSGPADPESFEMPYFNQVNIIFRETQIQCLLDHWYAETYKEEQPIVFRVINDVAAYNAFFSCKPGSIVRTIDFSKNSLLVGMKADLGKPVNSPVNIRKMEQNLTQEANGDYLLQVTVTGRQGGSAGGGEWFGFASLVPKIQNDVKLEMKYEFD
ncbi:hypothetical protein DYBT9623_03709 [Dyadobacter sp. CECT 9623]|uniref:Lipoprotein n=1 Tax=Dyadobacter linearis TaxID=2823330 RepID=A0ABM8UUG8_9BACT|nr:hypothetical protein [Dyadobacter sp. CECT 9623]CAG5071719.1 hypothetical protein DYBT9623_03709 [Dyadobacter sp. CECT 9623]